MRPGPRITPCPRHPARTLGAALLVAALGACGEEPPPPEPVLRPVRTVIAHATTTAAPETLAGVARAGIESKLSFRVPGSVDSLPVALGDRVEKGQLLARLDATDYRLQVEEAEAALAQARAAVRRAKADYDRVRALYENNNASKAELDAGRAAAESAAAQVEAGQLRLEQAEQQVGYTSLRAPLAGAVAEVEVERNENVQAGQLVVLLASGARPEVEVPTPEKLVGRLETGQRTLVAFDALAGERFEGRVSEIGVFSRGSAAYDVIVELLPGDGTEAIRSGMAAEVSFYFDAGREPTIRLPPLAVGEDRQGRFVFVLERGSGGVGVVHRRPVELGTIDGAGVAILGGLEPGEEVVTAGVRRLSDGMEVKVQEAAGEESVDQAESEENKKSEEVDVPR